MRNYYEILDVPYSASPTDIKKAYMALAKKYHPDITIFDKNAAEQIMKEINLAYATLSDSKKRADYDCTINMGKKSNEDNYENEHEYSEYNAFVILVNKVNNICLETINSIKDTASKANTSDLDNILNIFQKKIGVNAKKIVESPFMEEGLLEGVGVVYYMLAAHYFSNRCFDKAKRMNDCALVFLQKGEEVYNEALMAKQSIERAIANNDVNNSKSVLKKIAIGFFILFVLCSLASNNTKNSNTNYQNSKNTQAARTAPNSARNPSTSAPKLQNTELIPKKGIVSGYVPGSPVLNNTGLCELTIDNIQNSAPVYVRLWDLSQTPKPVRAINIAANSSFTIKNINPGVYEIRYKYIYENAEANTGSKSESFNLEQIKTYDGTQYSVVRLTLYKVYNGNSRTYSISGSDV